MFRHNLFKNYSSIKSVCDSVSYYVFTMAEETNKAL